MLPTAGTLIEIEDAEKEGARRIPNVTRDE
jgi:hypothetical protein